MITILVLLIIGVVLDTVAFFCEETEFSIIGCLGAFGRGVLIAFSAMIVVFIICKMDEGRDPDAIDVYKGDAVIKVVYTDSIPTDTIVVWKDGRKREW